MSAIFTMICGSRAAVADTTVAFVTRDGTGRGLSRGLRLEKYSNETHTMLAKVSQCDQPTIPRIVLITGSASWRTVTRCVFAMFPCLARTTQEGYAVTVGSTTQSGKSGTDLRTPKCTR